MRKDAVTRNQLHIQSCKVETTGVLKSSEEENAPTPHLDWGDKGGAGTKFLAHTISLFHEKRI